MKLKVVIIFILTSYTVWGQTKLTFSKQQMFNDFDTLVTTIFKVSPHIPIKKDLWNYDAKEHINYLRKSIDTVTTDLSYFLVLQSAINLAQDLHTSFIRQEDQWAKKQYDDYRMYRNKFKFSIGNIYNNGKYLTTDPFVINQDTIPVGTQITHINSTKIDNYIKGKLQTTSGFSYDLNNKKFYNSGILKNSETIFMDSLSVTLKNKKGSKTYRVATNKFTKYLPSSKYNDSTRVEYWEKEKLVYIRLTDMEPEFKTLILDELAQIKSKNLQIQKIVIDIRGNGGGQDNVWQGIYAALIATPIKYSLKIDDYQNAVMTKDKIESFGFENVKIEKDLSPLLKKYNFYTIINEEEVIEPSSTSLKFTGKIFILAEDVYSSAGSAVSVASSNPNDNLISVGRKSGYFLGVGFSPQIFTLPNTKLKYRIAPSIEVTNAKQLKDLMQDKIEIEVPIDMNYYQNKFSYKGKPTDKDFLIKYDPFIKVVLEYKMPSH
ncbi:MAG: S41 family peptidase [Raineya sp.]|jgi:hypothetical protein|nr:S41 family peptidase [Raineya sp.]